MRHPKLAVIVKFAFTLTIICVFQEVSGQSNVTWTNIANITVNGDVLSKSYNSQSTWNAGAISQQSFPNDGAVEFKFLANKYLRMGLAPYNASLDPASISHAMYSHINNYIEVYENGVQLQNIGKYGQISIGYTPTDVLSIERKNGIVYYKKNGTTFYTSTLASSGPLHADCSFYSFQATVQVTKFVAPDIWTGVVDSDWNKPQNWSLGRVPNTSDQVIVNACTVCPTLGSNVTLSGLLLNQGSKLDLATRRLSVNLVTTISGSMLTSNGGQIASQDFSDVKNSVFQGKVILKKTGGTNNICYGGNAFSPLVEIVNSSGKTWQLTSTANNSVMGQ